MASAAQELQQHWSKLGPRKASLPKVGGCWVGGWGGGVVAVAQRV